MRGLTIVTIGLLMAAPALAENTASVRIGGHTGFGRVVFEFPVLSGFTIERLGDMAIVHFEGTGLVPGADGGTRNVLSVRGGNSEAAIELAAGAKLRTARMGNRVVVDVLDPVRPASAQRKLSPPPVRGMAAAAKALEPVAAASTPTAPTSAAATSAAPTPAAPTPAAPTPAAPTPAPSTSGAPVATVIQAPLTAPGDRPSAPPAPPPSEPVHEGQPSAEPIGLAATRLDLPPGVAGSAALLPFGAKVGAAAYRHNGAAWVVFDERRPIDLAALQDSSLLADATVQLLTAATLVRIPLADGAALRLTRQASGWSVAALASAAALEPIIPVAQNDHLLLPSMAGNVVVVPDAETGQNLLVGTLRGSSAGLPVTYQQPEFVLRPSWQGVLLEPLSDQVSLRAGTNGFILETGAPIAPPPSATAALDLSAFLTRRFDFPAEAAPILMRRLQAQVAEAGRAPPQARAQPRLEAAQTMIALGMGAEAQSVLRLALEEDPRLAANPQAQGLAAVAALLGGRISESAALNDPSLSGTDEIALWRAVRAAQLQEGAPEAAAVFASTLPLILSYPQALQNRLLPLAAETMALGGAPEAADALLTKRADDPLLTYARALRLEAKGDTAASLAAYDALAQGRNRFAGARSAARATLLRLSTGAITTAVAAKSLEGQFLSWRGDARERDLRLRVAALRAEAGAWRPAFDLLRETGTLYPEAADLINGRRTEMLRDLLLGPSAAAIPAIDLVTLAEENAALVAAVAPAEISGLLADKLISLDLPRRAEPLLERMMKAATGVSQATLGARLASVRFGLSDDAGAAAALDSSNVANLPKPLLEERILLAARITARRGHPGAAAASLAALDTPAADDLRAILLTQAQDWQAAAKATQDFADKTVPPTGVIDPAQQDTLLRLATAEQRAGDTAALYALGKRAGGRFTGPRADMFHLLTAAPVDSVKDLRRASSEIALARAVPSALAAIGSH